MPAPTREELRDHLVATRIAGRVATRVWDVLRKVELVAAGDPEDCFGLTGMGRYTPDQILDQVTAQFGWAPAPGDAADDATYIDPDLLLDQLDLAGGRLAEAARGGEHVLLATGHPTGVLSLYQQVASGLRAAGAKLARPGDGVAFRWGDRRRQVRYLQHVAVLSSAGNLYHTHAAHPMELVLDQAGPVDLVVADHGWAGAAAERGLTVVAIADINDPALPMARSEGRVEVVVPMDDNVLPAAYDPVGEYLVSLLQ